MFQFIKNYILPIITVTVSFSSLLISLITLHSNRKRLDVEIENNLDDISDIYFNILNFTNSSSDLNFGNGKVCFLKIVNPSPKDIAFFDLRLIDLRANKPIFFLTNALLELTNYTNKKLFYNSKGTLSKINIPDSNYGIFKANSFTRLDLAFYPEEKTKVLISFKVAISSLKNNKEAGVRKKFKYYRKEFIIS